MDLSIVSLAAPSAAQSIFFRLCPFAAYALLDRSLALGQRVAVFGAFALSAAACLWLHANGLRALNDCVAGYALLCGLACLAHRVTPLLVRCRATRAALLLLSLTLFMLAPALLLRNSVALLVLAVGFETTLALFSYWFECTRAKGTEHASLGAALTFLLVDPTLIFGAHARQGAARFGARPLARLVLGIAGLWLAPALAIEASSRLPDLTARGLPGSILLPSLLLANLLALYVSHASLAHVQIAAMRLLGYAVPERFEWPVLANSPDDFWRRWNIYFGAWLQRYVYLPCAMSLQRRMERRFWPVAKGSAVLCVFGLCGLLHELAGYALRFRMPMGVVLAFVGYGAVLSLWTPLRAALQRAAVRYQYERSTVYRALSEVTSRAVTTCALVTFGWIALPALSGAGLPEALHEWLAP